MSHHHLCSVNVENKMSLRKVTFPALKSFLRGQFLPSYILVDNLPADIKQRETTEQPNLFRAST